MNLGCIKAYSSPDSALFYTRFGSILGSILSTHLGSILAYLALLYDIKTGYFLPNFSIKKALTWWLKSVKYKGAEVEGEAEEGEGEGEVEGEGEGEEVIFGVVESERKTER